MSQTPTHGLVSASDIADMAEVSRGAVSNWRRRFEDFPDPVAGSAAKPLFPQPQVLSWLSDRGYTVERDHGAEVWAALNVLRADLSPEQAAKLILDLATGIDVTTAAASAGISDKDADPMKNALDQVDRGELGAVADYCMERLHRAQVRTGGDSGFIGSRTSALLAALAARRHGSVLYDPACGIGAALVQARLLGAMPERTIGHDIDTDALTIATQRARLHGIDMELKATDVLAEDLTPGLRADTIIAEPPFGMNMPTSARLTDPRFADLPPRFAEMAWIRHSLSHLADNGRAFVITPAGLLRLGIAARLRTELVQQGCIEAVVALPPRMLPNTALPLALWVLRPPTESPESTIFIDATDVADPEKTVVDWLTEPPADKKDRYTQIPAGEILAHDSVLDPLRWLFTPAESDQNLANYARNLATITDRANQITTAVAGLKDTLTKLPANTAQVHTIKKLIDEGVIEQRRARIARNHTDSPETPNDQLVTARDIKDLRILDTVVTTPMRDSRILTNATEPGDVLVSTIREVWACVDRNGGHVPSPSLAVLRVRNHDVLTPEYLAVVLTGAWNGRFHRGITIPRAPLRELEVPLPSLEDQHHIYTLISQLDQLSYQATDLAGSTSEVIAAVLNAVRYDLPLT